MPELSYAQVNELLRYDAETGKLFWKPRPLAMFSDTGNGAIANCSTFNKQRANKEAFTAKNKYGYLHGVILYQHHRAHRIAWLLHHGKWPDGSLDHINGDPSDNRIVNLRDVPHFVSRRNSKLSARNKSGTHGVYADGNGRWKAHIKTHKGYEYLGVFPTKEAAAAVRRAAEADHGYHPNHGR